MLAASGCATVAIGADHDVSVVPAVALHDLDDHAVRLEAAAGGKPALVSFWATWCEACAAEFDALNRLSAQATRSGGVVIGVAVGETREKAAELARRRGLTYPQLVDEKLSLADALGQKRLPATLVLDRTGHIVFTGGALDERALAAFRAVMMGGAQGPPQTPLASPKPPIP